MFSRSWWIGTRNRAARSMAQAFLLATGAAGLGWKQLNWIDVIWITVAFTAGSVAHSIIQAPASPEEKP